MATTPKKKKPRNMQDSTLRLHRALVKRVQHEQAQRFVLQVQVKQLAACVKNLEYDIRWAVKQCQKHVDGFGD